MEGMQMQSVEAQLRIAHDKLMQAQQKLDNRELKEQMLLEQALDAINVAQTTIRDKGQYTYMNE